MKDNNSKSNSCSESQGENLTIFDAPNVCREMIAKCDLLAMHPDPAVAKVGAEVGCDAKRMLDAIIASIDQLLASAA